MDETKDKAAFKGVAERLTLGVIRILENMPGVADVRFAEREPAEKRSLLSWEQRNGCILPEDLRDFYLTTDGFRLSWSVKLDNESVPLGSLAVNSVAHLVALVPPVSLFSLPNAPSLSDLDDSVSSDSVVSPPHFDSRSRVFELDSSGSNGKVCLVYKNCTPGVVAQSSEVWFLDRCLCWHLLSSSFTSFFRLLLTHLGLPEWESNYTPYGPSPQARQWASLYRPLIFLDPEDPPTDPPLNRLDPTRAFRTKTKTPPKKKTSAPAGTTGGGRAGAGRGATGGPKR